MRVTILFSILILNLFANAQDLPQPTREAVPPSDSEKAALKEGVALHDAGNYNEAIAKYQEILRQNPANLTAIHELAYSCYTAKKFDCSMQAARTGATFKSPELAYFYMMIANIYDDQGDNKQADSVYRFAIQQSPRLAILHFNYGVNLLREHNTVQARQELEAALALNPNHPGSNLTLGRAYEESGYRVPAILAYSRFIALEPNSPRTASTIERLQKLLVHNVTNGEKAGNINITLQADAPKDEGDFVSADMAISIGVAAATTETEKNKSPFDHLANTYLVLSEVVADAKGGFAATFYAPFFKRLYDHKLTEAFVAYAWQSANLQGADEWRSMNGDKIKELESCCLKN